MALRDGLMDVAVSALLAVRQGNTSFANSSFGGNPDVPADAPYPYSGLQIFGIFLLFAFPFLSTIVCGLRLYSKHIAGLSDGVSSRLPC